MSNHRAYTNRVSFVLAVLLAIGAGCRTATVSQESRSNLPPGRPSVVYVGEFDLGASALQSDPGTITGRPRLLPRLRPDQDPDPAAQVAKLQSLLASDIISDLNRAGIAAGPLPAGARPTEGWLVSGEFLSLQEGNRAQRAIIGFGAGSSDAKLYVSLADLAHPEGQRLLTFNTDTTPDKSPGGGITALATHTPWGMVTKYALDRNASEKDIAATANAISDEVVKISPK